MSSFRSIALITCLLGTPFAMAEGWIHWRGNLRNDVVSESSGWNGSEWPLKEAWSTNVGEGSSSPIVVGEQVFATGWRDNREHVFCLSAVDGKEVWRVDYPAPRYGRHSIGDKGIYSGISGSPEYDPTTGLLYTLGIDGDLNCWDTRQNGKKTWSVNLYDVYKTQQRPDVGGRRAGKSRRDYGYTIAPFVYENQLLVEVGSTSKGSVVAYHKTTGKQLWMSDCRDEAGHTGGFAPINVDQIPCVALLTMRRLVILRLDAGNEGKTLAEKAWTTDFANNIPTPTVVGQSLILTSAYNQYAMCRLDVSSSGITQVWKSESPSGVCSPLVHDGHVYWAWRGIHCVDFANGQEKWLGKKVGTAGSCVMTSDDRLVVLADDGDLYLIESAKRSPQTYTELASNKQLFRTDCWPHVTLAGDKLYCKDRDGNLKCWTK